jgi:stearoyl-CoA desaturase (delta-9 desaturase)
LGFIGASSGQNGPLWWAGVHRLHHKYSDTEADPHSPIHGLWISHVGWIFQAKNLVVPPGTMKDFERYPEVRYLERAFAPTVSIIVLAFALLRWQGLVALAVSTVALYHGTFFVNSICHVFGTSRHQTDDRSRNNWWVALLTLGEGWHNNHHHHQSSARQGFFWWEYDVTFYVLTLLSWLGIVWDLRPPTAASNENRTPKSRSPSP